MASSAPTRTTQRPARLAGWPRSKTGPESWYRLRRWREGSWWVHTVLLLSSICEWHSGQLQPACSRRTLTISARWNLTADQTQKLARHSGRSPLSRLLVEKYYLAYSGGWDRSPLMTQCSQILSQTWKSTILNLITTYQSHTPSERNGGCREGGICSLAVA